MLTVRERLEALARGEKIRFNEWPKDEYIYLKDDELVWNLGGIFVSGLLLDVRRTWELYVAPTVLECTVAFFVDGSFAAFPIGTDFRGNLVQPTHTEHVRVELSLPSRITRKRIVVEFSKGDTE